MYAHYPESFQRDMGCTESEWLRWLPAALGDHPCTVQPQLAQVQLPGGILQLQWHAAPPRVIAQVRMPRLVVQFQFVGVDEAARHAFMTRFDLYMQRGGG